MTALLLEPHADDAVLFSCWNLLRHRPKVVTCFRSDRMADPAYPGGQVSHETRVAESTAAMQLLGVDWLQLEFSDAAPDYRALRHLLENLDRYHAFEYVFAPAFEVGGHDQHNAVSEIAADLFGERVVSYLTYTAEGRSTHGHEVYFEPGWPVLKLRALACYESQIAHPATAPHFLTGLREWVA